MNIVLMARSDRAGLSGDRNLEEERHRDQECHLRPKAIVWSGFPDNDLETKQLVPPSLTPLDRIRFGIPECTC